MTRRSGGLVLCACAAVVLSLSGPAAGDPAMDAAIADTWSFANSRLSWTIGDVKAKYGEANYRKWYPRETITTAGATYQPVEEVAWASCP